MFDGYISLKKQCPACALDYAMFDAGDGPAVFGILMIFMIAATAVYGPQAAALVELFPTRVRYTAMSLSYNVGTGWVGGLLPAASFALVAWSGNIYFGLWYSVGFTAVAAAVALLFLPETRGRDLNTIGE